MFSDYILSHTPKFSDREWIVSHLDKLSEEIIKKIHTAFQRNNDKFERLVEITEEILNFKTKNGTIRQYRTIKSTKTNEILGYVSTDIEPNIWNCEFTPNKSKIDDTYNKTYRIRLLNIQNTITNNFEFQEGSIPFEELFNEGDEEYWESERRSWWNEFRLEHCQDDDEDYEDIDEIEGREYSQEVFDSAKYKQTLVKKYISMHNLPDEWQPDNIEKWFADNIDILDPF